MKHSFMIVGLDYLLDVAEMSSNENPRPYLAWRTLKAPIRPVRRFDRIERRPRWPPTCLA